MRGCEAKRDKKLAVVELLYSVKTEHSVTMRNVLFEENSDKKLVSGALVKTEHSITMRDIFLKQTDSDKKLAIAALLLVLASLLKTRFLAVTDIP